jgi:hypothetical protein
LLARTAKVPFASDPHGAPGSLVETLAELRRLLAADAVSRDIEGLLASPRLNLEMDRYPRYEFVPDPAGGPTAVKPLPWRGEFIPHYPLTVDRLEEELSFLWRLRSWASPEPASGRADSDEILRLVYRAIGINRAIWRDVRITESRGRADLETVGRFIHHLRRRTPRGSPEWKVRWANPGLEHHGGRLPNDGEVWVVLHGGVPPHVLATHRVVVDLGHCSFLTWAICTNDGAHVNPCRCHFCMHTINASTTRDPDLAQRVSADPHLALLGEYSTASGWGSDGPLTAIRAVEPDISAERVHLLSLFGRKQVEAAEQQFDYWFGVRKSGKNPGRPETPLDETTFAWVRRRQADGKALRSIYQELLQRPGVPYVAFSTFLARLKRSDESSGRKTPFSANPD